MFKRVILFAIIACASLQAMPPALTKETLLQSQPAVEQQLNTIEQLIKNDNEFQPLQTEIDAIRREYEGLENSEISAQSADGMFKFHAFSMKMKLNAPMQNQQRKALVQAAVDKLNTILEQKAGSPLAQIKPQVPVPLGRPQALPTLRPNPIMMPPTVQYRPLPVVQQLPQLSILPFSAVNSILKEISNQESLIEQSRLAQSLRTAISAVRDAVQEMQRFGVTQRYKNMVSKLLAQEEEELAQLAELPRYIKAGIRDSIANIRSLLSAE